MARQTKKYMAAAAQLRELGKRVPSNATSEKLYEQLEEAGYWWNTEAWTNAPRPTSGRSKRVSIEGSGTNPDLVEFRITAALGKLEQVTQLLRRLADSVGWNFVQQSEGYENRDQDETEDTEKRVRVYSSFIVPSDEEQS